MAKNAFPEPWHPLYGAAQRHSPDRPLSYMDVLSELLLHLNLCSELQAMPRCFAPWGLSFDADPNAIFHLILGGTAMLRLPNLPTPMELHAGDYVLLPHGHAHELSDATGSPLQPMAELAAGKDPQEVAELRIGGEGRETLLVSGRYCFERNGVHPLLSELPPVLRVGCGDGWRSMPLEHGVQLLSAELASSNPGSRAIVGHLLEVLFLQALRCYVEDVRGNQPGWLRSLRDERIARALGCIHGEPQRAWSSAELAAQAGMPRAAFVAEFTALVGEPPPLYLDRWRIHKALRSLREPGLALEEVARQIGFSSTTAFARTFKRIAGMTPAEYRRSMEAGDEPLLQAEPLAGAAASGYDVVRTTRL